MILQLVVNTYCGTLSSAIEKFERTGTPLTELMSFVSEAINNHLNSVSDHCGQTIKFKLDAVLKRKKGFEAITY